MNLPWLTELFVNFGGLGVALGMVVIGAFMAFVDRFFNAVEMAPAEAMVALPMVVPLVYQESNFSVMTGSLLPLAVTLFVIFHVGLRYGR